MKKKWIILMFMLPVALVAQAPPSTDIFLIPAKKAGDTPKLGSATNITSRTGYDNQPHFTSDNGAILYTSSRKGQTDIYKYELNSRKHVRMTATKESEYSPTPTPDGAGFSVIRVETSEPLMQRLWKFPLKKGKPEIVLHDINPVGYHAWGTGRKLGLFVLGKPNSFQVADIKTGKGTVLFHNIGRSMHKIPGQAAISINHTPAAKGDNPEKRKTWIKKVDITTNAVTTICEMLEGSLYYAWLDETHIIAGRDGKIFVLNTTAPKWKLVKDFTEDGLVGITRIAVSPDRNFIAIVGDR